MCSAAFYCHTAILRFDAIHQTYLLATPFGGIKAGLEHEKSSRPLIWIWELLFIVKHVSEQITSSWLFYHNAESRKRSYNIADTAEVFTQLLYRRQRNHLPLWFEQQQKEDTLEGHGEEVGLPVISAWASWYEVPKWPWIKYSNKLTKPWRYSFLLFL